jgi:hypothetical protein
VADRREYRNIRFRQETAFAAIGTFVVVYVVPGIILGRYVKDWAGLALIALGAVFYVVFAWRCMFPDTLSFDRDTVRTEGRYRDTLVIGYEKIHEARWDRTNGPWMKLLGPLVFAEPPWFMQYKSGRKIVLQHGGEPLELREDEFGDLSELAEELKRRHVAGFADTAQRPLKTFGGPKA